MPYLSLISFNLLFFCIAEQSNLNKSDPSEAAWCVNMTVGMEDPLALWQSWFSSAFSAGSLLNKRGERAHLKKKSFSSLHSFFLPFSQEEIIEMPSVPGMPFV